jgi:hypothetical protein
MQDLCGAKMIREDIIRMAIEAGFLSNEDSSGCFAASDFDMEICAEEYAYGEIVERFANLVEAASAAAEREACAQVCDDLPVPPYVSDNDAHIWDLTCVDCAAAIRARGQQ